MAAGLGFKNFSTGDVLTAADVNGYLMQGVWVFANATARSAAVTSPAEGNMSYLSDTNSLEYYSGSAWVAVAGTLTSPLTTKGDVWTYSTTNARLGVGSNGDALVADSTTTTGLRWQANFCAGKNAILNGDFRFNQRNFTSNTTSASYNFDRWRQENSGGSFTVTPQTFTPGAAPVAGYEGINFVRGITAAQSAAGDYALLGQRIEDVRTYAGSTVTVSFWAKANTGTPKIGVELSQNFGSGGSPSSQVNTAGGSVTLSTSWARYSVTVSVPSISGKTIGTTANSSYLELNLWTSSGATNAARASSIGIQNFTADIWGVQVEPGSVATAFETATGTIAGELDACRRYYYRYQVTSGNLVLGNGWQDELTAGYANIFHPVPMRAIPTSYDYSGLQMTDYKSYTNAATFNAAFNDTISAVRTRWTMSSAGAIYRPLALIADNTSAHWGANAEL